MNDVSAFLRTAADLAGVEPADVLAKVFHVNGAQFEAEIATMDERTRTLARRLDYEIRVRNPGLHYVARKMFVGYRREGGTPFQPGERSQIFVSMLRVGTRLEVVLPINADTISAIPNAHDLRGTGHHGVGDVRVTIAGESEIDQFLIDFKDWIAPKVATTI